MANKDANFVGIIALKDTALDQPGIVRLGPPPGNAGVLIRGGAGWVLDRPTRKPAVDPRITRQDEPPTYDEIALALTRELAYRWFYGRERGSQNVIRPGERGFSKMARKLFHYADAERGFVESARSLRGATLPDLILHHTSGVDCQCIEGTRCCTGTCQSCQEG